MALQFPEGINTRKELKEWLLDDVAQTHEILESKTSDFGKTLWMAIKPMRMNPRVAGNQIAIACFRMEKSDESWGYIEYSESTNPYTDCPDSVFELAGDTSTPGALKWRERVLR